MIYRACSCLSRYFFRELLRAIFDHLTHIRPFYRSCYKFYLLLYIYNFEIFILEINRKGINWSVHHWLIDFSHMEWTVRKDHKHCPLTFYAVDGPAWHTITRQIWTRYISIFERQKTTTVFRSKYKKKTNCILGWM